MNYEGIAIRKVNTLMTHMLMGVMGGSGEVLAESDLVDLAEPSRL